MKPKTKKRVVIPASVVLLLFVLKFCVGQNAYRRKSSSVRLEEVLIGALTEIVTASGQIEPKRNGDIRAKVSAGIVDLPENEGCRAKEGDLLIRLDARDLESRLWPGEATYESQKAQIAGDKVAIAQEQAAFKAIESRMEPALCEYQRNLKLLTSKDICKATFGEFECAMEEQTNAYEAGRHDLKAKELSLIVQEHNLKSSSISELLIPFFSGLTAEVDIETRTHQDIIKVPTQTRYTDSVSAEYGTLANYHIALMQLAQSSGTLLGAAIIRGMPNEHEA